jgi:hypothetical protein
MERVVVVLTGNILRWIRTRSARTANPQATKREIEVHGPSRHRYDHCPYHGEPFVRPHVGHVSQPASPSQDPADGLVPEQEWLAAHANPYAGSTHPSHLLSPTVQAIVDPQHHRLAVGVQVGTAPADPNLKTMGGFVQSYVQFCDPAPADPSLVMGYNDADALPVYAFLRSISRCATVGLPPCRPVRSQIGSWPWAGRA